jgi:hypothetical protein
MVTLRCGRRDSGPWCHLGWLEIGHHDERRLPDADPGDNTDGDALYTNANATNSHTDSNFNTDSCSYSHAHAHAKSNASGTGHQSFDSDASSNR